MSALLLLALIGLGAGERVFHLSRLKRIPIRIHVNGSRGKSTVTRLIAGALREAGIRTIARTTGTAARLIDEDGAEQDIPRTGRARITEIRGTIRLAAKRGADAVIIECMALDPRLQQVAESSLVRSTIGVITNVRDDHLDIMGPGLAEVAAALANTVPRNGVLVTAEKRFLAALEDRARILRCRVVAATAEALSESERQGAALDWFDENVALALAVASEAGVARDVALRGMRKARPDLGALAMWGFDSGGTTVRVVNAFAANDWISTRAILEKLKERTGTQGAFFVLYGHRPDRVERGLAFARGLAEESAGSRISGIMQIGPRCPGFRHTLKSGGYPPERIHGEGSAPSPESIMRTVAALSRPEDIVVGMGNIAGMGMRLASLWSKAGRAVALAQARDTPHG